MKSGEHHPGLLGCVQLGLPTLVWEAPLPTPWSWGPGLTRPCQQDALWVSSLKTVTTGALVALLQDPFRMEGLHVTVPRLSPIPGEGLFFLCSQLEVGTKA